MKKALIYAFITWLVPFVVSTPLMGRDGAPVIDLFLFKTLMLLIGTAVGTFLMVRLIVDATDPLRAGLVTGGLFLTVNLGLDALVLIPLSGMGGAEYLQAIGLRYLVMPMVAFGLGWVAMHNREAHV